MAVCSPAEPTSASPTGLSSATRASGRKASSGERRTVALHPVSQKGAGHAREHFKMNYKRKYIPEAEIIHKDGRQKYTIELEEFEFKLRGRVVLEIIADRCGQLPEAVLKE